jgi:enamine deaminase RidA (YjgF/YER057c/UK114 family)
VSLEGDRREGKYVPKQPINPPTLWPSLPHGFSQGMSCPGGRTVYLSGQTAWDANKAIVGGHDLKEQTCQALRNVQAAVEAAGGCLGDVVSLRIYLVDYRPDDGAAVSEALRAFFPGDGPPASTWIGVSALAVEDFRVEIEAIAHIS